MRTMRRSSPDIRLLPQPIRRAAAQATVGVALAASLFGLGCGGKASPFKPIAGEALPAVAPATKRIEHVVLIELLDPADAAELKADSDRLLPTIPDVRGYASGTPVDIGRGNVSRDYHVGLIVRFDSVEGYKAYLAHPAHEQLVQKWRPRWRKASIADFAP